MAKRHGSIHIVVFTQSLYDADTLAKCAIVSHILSTMKAQSFYGAFCFVDTITSKMYVNKTRQTLIFKMH